MCFFTLHLVQYGKMATQNIFYKIIYNFNVSVCWTMEENMLMYDKKCSKIRHNQCLELTQNGQTVFFHI